MTEPDVYTCPRCGLIFGQARAVDGLTPIHPSKNPLRPVCEGSGKVPNVWGEREPLIPDTVKGA